MKLVLQSVAIAFVVVVIIFLWKLYLSSSSQSVTPDKVVTLKASAPCYLAESSCLFVAGQRQIEISLSGEIRTMKSFKLLAKLNNFNSSIKKVQVNFSMQSMKMGFNHFQLLEVKNTNSSRYWQTSILLPVCVSRRTDWLMTLSIIAEDTIYQVGIPLQIN